MKRLSLVIFLFFAGKMFSQENLFLKIREQINKEYPQLNTANKLIVVNVWSADDSKSREANVQLNKAYIVYESAKLKGGLKGMIGVTICKDNNPGSSVILSNDKVTKPVSLNNAEIDITGFSNIIFDTEGKVVNKNFSTDIFNEINKLITR